MTTTPQRLRIQLTKSPIGYTQRHRLTLQALGLRKMNQTVEHGDTPQIRGMIYYVNHLVKVQEIPAE